MHAYSNPRLTQSFISNGKDETFLFNAKTPLRVVHGRVGHPNRRMRQMHFGDILMFSGIPVEQFVIPFLVEMKNDKVTKLHIRKCLRLIKRLVGTHILHTVELLSHAKNFL